MRVLRAQRSRAGEPAAVHVFPVQDPHRSPEVLVSSYGEKLNRDDAEEVPERVGAACSTCLLHGFAVLALRSSPAPLGSNDIENYPASTSSTGSYAVALAGERVVHLVLDGAARGKRNGRDVVQAVCCHLGWGRVVSAPPDWPVCDECRRIIPIRASAPTTGSHRTHIYP